MIRRIRVRIKEEDRDGSVSSDRESRAKNLSNESEDDCLEILEK